MIITHSNITDQIVRYFKDQITSGAWKVGEKIPSENQLTQTLGVSRASIRTAIQQLVGIGVLVSQHGKGTYLMDDQVDERASLAGKITAEDCKDTEKVLEFRRIVESEACFLAAKHLTDEQIDALQHDLNQMVANKKNLDQFVSADIHFHELICKASQNPLLEKSMSRIFEELKRSHDRTYHLSGSKDGIYFHRLILDALRKGDGERARECMYEHMQMGIDQLNSKRKELEKQEEFSSSCHRQLL